MIEGRLIVCIASSWDYDPTSKHHVMKALARKNDVLWVNYHASRRPGLNRHDMGAGIRVLKKIARGVQTISPSMSQMTPVVIPGAKSRIARYFHEQCLIEQIRQGLRTMTRGRRQPIQVWSFAPDVPFLVGAFHEECFVYYCVDSFRHFEGYDETRIASVENQIVDRADVVVASSGPLYKALRKRRMDTCLVPHGVDYDHFASAWRDPPHSGLSRKAASPPACPKDLQDVTGPVFGFFGLIDHWVDLDLIARVAKLRPHYTFVLIGDAKVDVSALRGLANVRLLGRQPYRTLPAYCARFIAGLMLFKQTVMTRHVNPIKMREYLAAGLPVLSTPLPEAARQSGAITIAETPELFAEACDGIVRQEPPDRQTVSLSVVDETWATKVERLSQIVARHTGNVTAPASMPRDTVVYRETKHPHWAADIPAHSTSLP